MHWQKFVSLSKDYRQLQLSMLSSATPEEMDLRGLTMWGKLCGKALAYAHRIESDKTQPSEVHEHWAILRSHCVRQVERVATAVSNYIAMLEADATLSAWERCQIFELAGLCSALFQDEADAIAMANTVNTDIPSSISAETLAKLQEFRNGQS